MAYINGTRDDELASYQVSSSIGTPKLNKPLKSTW